MPDFVGIGFQKCGTTTMYDLLIEHPQVLLTRDVKEPMFYRVPFIYHAYWPWRKKYYSWRYFGHVTEEETRMIGEVNAGLGYNGCAKMLTRDFDHETKLFFMLRNPVNRAYSAFKFFCSLGFLPARVVKEDLQLGHAEAFGRYCRRVLSSPKRVAKIGVNRMEYICFSQGNYADLVEEYAAFPHQHIILFEEFVRDQKGECEKLYDFLGLSAPEEGIPYGIKVNETNHRAVSPLRSKWRLIVKGGDYVLDEFFAMNRWWPWGYRRYHAYTKKMLHECTVADEDKSRMKPETRALLEDYYRPQKQRMERLLGRSLNELWFE